MEAERDQKEQEREAKRMAKRRGDLEACATALQKADDPPEIAKLIRRGGPALGEQALATVWKRLMAAGQLGAPPHEVVTVKFSYRRPIGSAAKELSRIGAWRFHPRLQRKSDWFLIDIDGVCWDDYGEVQGSSKSIILPPMGGGVPTRSIAVAAGVRVDARRRSGWHGWSIRSGTPVRRNEAPDSERWVEAIAGAIEGVVGFAPR